MIKQATKTDANLKRNNEMELFRFLFIIAIAVMHFSNSYFKSCPYYSGAYIGTEFFFLLSGFMIAKKAFCQGDALSPYQFTFQRMKKLYPDYLFAFFLLFILSLVSGAIACKDAFKTLFGYIFELLFLHASGLKCSGLLNYPTWYLSSLLIGGCMIYGLICFHQKLYLTIIAPVSVIATYSFFSANVGHMDVWGSAQILHLSDGLTRGFAAMSLGCLSYCLSSHISQFKNHVEKNFGLKLLLTLSELFCLCFVLFDSAFVADSQMDFYLILLLFIGITLSFSNITFTGQIFSQIPFLGFLGKLSYQMYVYQLFIICLFCLYLPNLGYRTGILCFLLCLIAFSLLVYQVKKLVVK